MKKAKSIGDRICIVCDTPYQLLNTINFVCNQKEFDASKIDLLLCKRDFSDLQIHSIKELQLFDAVYIYKTDLVSPRKKKNFFYRANRFFRPRKYVYSLIIDEAFDYNKYSRLICAFPIPLVVAITNLNPDLTINLMDDGIGTYIGQIPNPDSYKRKILLKLRGKSSPWSRIEAVYVNNERLYSGNIAKKVISLPQIEEDDDHLVRVLSLVFPYKREDIYNTNKVVYLTQPLDTIFENQNRFWAEERDIINKLKQSETSVVVRKHPKHKKYLDHAFCEDSSNNLWELVCANQITENHILVSCYSTAQFSPKFLYDKEPWLIFTFLLYSELLESEKIAEMEKMISTMRKHYRDKSKIVVIEDINALIPALRRAIEKK